jgi:transcriptional regulator with XRE-family HTH domain
MLKHRVTGKNDMGAWNQNGQKCLAKFPKIHPYVFSLMGRERCEAWKGIALAPADIGRKPPNAPSAVPQLRQFMWKELDNTEWRIGANAMKANRGLAFQPIEAVGMKQFKSAHTVFSPIVERLSIVRWLHSRAMKTVQQILGTCIRMFREQHGWSLEHLAELSGVSYQYLSGVETGKKNFTVQVLERLSAALGFPVKALVATAYNNAAGLAAPVVQDRFFRPQVPLPAGLAVDHLCAALNRTQAMVHVMNRNMIEEVGSPLQGLIQGNNFSGLVSNIFSNCMDSASPYKHNHDQRYPDLINKKAAKGKGVGLEVKLTVNIGKGGESHNGHHGWHVIACYNFTGGGDIVFVHVMFAELNGHRDANPDWSYVGSKVNVETGSRRTETYVTNLKGTTKLRDGSVYINSDAVQFRRWRQERDGAVPDWSIFSPRNLS